MPDVPAVFTSKLDISDAERNFEAIVDNFHALRRSDAFVLVETTAGDGGMASHVIAVGYIDGVAGDRRRGTVALTFNRALSAVYRRCNIMGTWATPGFNATQVQLGTRGDGSYFRCTTDAALIRNSAAGKAVMRRIRESKDYAARGQEMRC